LLDQITRPLSSFTADGAYDQDGVYTAVADRHAEAAMIVPPRRTGGPERYGCDRADTARPPSPVHNRNQPQDLAKSHRLKQVRQGRGGDRTMETGDR
jgi:hypothetical protein